MIINIENRWTETRDGSMFDSEGLPAEVIEKIRDHIKVWNEFTAAELIAWVTMPPEDHWALCEERIAELEAAS